MGTTAHALVRALRARGITEVYGEPVAGLDVVPVDGSGPAILFAEAHARVLGAAAATVHDGVLDLRDPARRDLAPDQGGAPPPTVVGGADELLAAVADPHIETIGLDLDLSAPGPDIAPTVVAPVERWIEPPDELVDTLMAARSPVLLVGPGLVRAGAVPGLHAIAAVAHLGVLNTWGAKGVFDWRSRHHLATAGLQRDDYVLGGLADADLIVTCGLDPDEAPPGHWRLAPTVDVAPASLDPLSARWFRAATPIDVPALRAGLARVTQEGWAVDRGPLPPSRLTRTYAALLGTGGLVAADAGIAGFWVARTYATTELGAVQVPGRRRPGLAVACAAVARRADPYRRVLAVIDGSTDADSTADRSTDRADLVDDVSRGVLEAAARIGVTVPVEVWSSSGPALDADAHAARLDAATVAARPGPMAIATDASQLPAIEAVAGPVVAWGLDQA